MKLIIETDIELEYDEKTIKELEETLSYLLPVIVSKAQGNNPFSFSEEFATTQKYLDTVELAGERANIKIKTFLKKPTPEQKEKLKEKIKRYQVKEELEHIYDEEIPY